MCSAGVRIACPGTSTGPRQKPNVSSPQACLSYNLCAAHVHIFHIWQTHKTMYCMPYLYNSIQAFSAATHMNSNGPPERASQKSQVSTARSMASSATSARRGSAACGVLAAVRIYGRNSIVSYRYGMAWHGMPVYGMVKYRPTKPTGKRQTFVGFLIWAF